MASHDSTDYMRSHRRVLATIDNYAGSNSDGNSSTDDDFSVSTASGQSDEDDAVLGVSIGTAQYRMRSATTPAAEKVQALEASRGYFDDQCIGEEDEDEDNDGIRKDLVSNPDSQSNGLQKDTASCELRETHNSRAVPNTKTAGEQTSSHGSNLLQSLKKVIPGVSQSGCARTPVDTITRDYKAASDELNVDLDNDRSTDAVRSYTNVVTDSSGDVTSSIQADDTGNDHTPCHVRRDSSENSLYLKREVSGASRWDDVSVWADKTEMSNARSKAMRDSWADASWKLPKLPSLTQASPRRSSEQPGDVATQSNPRASSRRYSLRGLSSTVSAILAGTSQEKSRPVPKNTRHPHLKTALACATGDIVIMGGYRGSVLRSAEAPHHQLWAPVKIGLGVRKVDLEVGLSHEDEARMEEKIYADGTLSHVGPIDISRRLLQKMNKSPNVTAGTLRIHNYGYDWRLSPHLLCERLTKFLEGLQCNQLDTPAKDRGAIVIAHSLGGLITRHVANDRPELFAGVVYAGTPQNCVNILGPLRNGDDVLLTSKILTAQVNFSFRTSFALLPVDGKCFINKDTGERYDVDFFDANNWAEYRLSPCIRPPLPVPAKPAFPQARRRTLVGSSIPVNLEKGRSWFTSNNNDENNNTDQHNPTTPTLSSHGKDSHSIDHDQTPTEHSSKTIRDKASEVKTDLKQATRTVNDHTSALSPKSPMGGNTIQPSMPGSSSGQASNAEDDRNIINHNNANNNSAKASPAVAVTIPLPVAQEYLHRTLSQVKAFKSQLTHNPTHQSLNKYPPFAILYGKTTPTVYAAKVSSREAIKYATAYDDLAFASGDGVVLASAAQLPSGYRCVQAGRVESDRGHVSLLGDLEGIGRCIRAVIDGRQRGIGLGSTPSESGSIMN